MMRSEVRVSEEDISQILDNLKSGKAPGLNGLAAEAFKYGKCTQLIFLIQLIIAKMFRHNVIPHLFNVGLIMPIVKDSEEDPNNIANIRPITISDTIANIYERVLLKEMDRVWPNIGKQYGFKKHSSCSHAIFTLRETSLLKMKTR